MTVGNCAGLCVIVCICVIASTLDCLQLCKFVSKLVCTCDCGHLCKLVLHLCVTVCSPLMAFSVCSRHPQSGSDCPLCITQCIPHNPTISPTVSPTIDTHYKLHSPSAGSVSGLVYHPPMPIITSHTFGGLNTRFRVHLFHTPPIIRLFNCF